MKRLCTLGFLTLALALTSQREASAWCNMKFGAGVNFELQSGDTSWLWGLFRSGQVPYPPPGPGVAPYPPPGIGGYPPPGIGGFEYGPAAVAAPAAPATAQGAPAPGAAQASQVNYSHGGQVPYQPVGYFRTSTVPSYPAQSPGSYTQQRGPDYWYGR